MFLGRDVMTTILHTHNPALIRVPRPCVPGTQSCGCRAPQPSSSTTSHPKQLLWKQLFRTHGMTRRADGEHAIGGFPAPSTLQPLHCPLHCQAPTPLPVALPGFPPAAPMLGWLMQFWPLMTAPFSSSAPSVMTSSVTMAGSTVEPSGMRATRLNRKMALSMDRKKVRAPAKKKLPGG